MVETTLTVTAENRDYIQCPLETVIEYDLAPRPQAALVDVDSGAVVPAQLGWPDDGSEDPLLHWIEPALLRGQTRTYRITEQRAEWPETVVLKQQKDNIEVQIDGQFFTGYRYGVEWVRPFLHPLSGPTGPVTRRHPMETGEGETKDHPHHKSCWVAHGDVNGTDNWSEQGNHGRTSHEQLLAAEGGPVFGHIETFNKWRDSADNPLLDEQRIYRFYRSSPGARVFDQIVRLTALEQDVIFGDTKEGGLCSIRVATSMDAPSGQFTNAYGAVNEKEGWGKPAPWCDYTGPVGGRTVGVAIFDHPRNFRHPTPWHVRNYGLMTANPFGLSYFAGNPDGEPDGSMKLPAGETVLFRYRVLVHAGSTAEANVAERYQHWINPPKMELVITK